MRLESLFPIHPEAMTIKMIMHSHQKFQLSGTALSTNLLKHQNLITSLKISLDQGKGIELEPAFFLKIFLF